MNVPFCTLLSLGKHVTALNVEWFFQLRQDNHAASHGRSMTSSSSHCVVHAFVVSRVDYCLRLLAGAIDEEHDRQVATCLESCRTAGKYDFRRHVLHWLDVADRIRFRLCVQVFKCQHSMAPGYLAELCRPVSSIDGHRPLRSARRDQLDVP